MDAYARAPVTKVAGKGQTLSDAIARVVARHVGLSDELVDRALAERRSVRGRQELIELGGVTVMAERRVQYQQYQSSLDGARTGDAGRARCSPRRRVTVLGEMAELGEESARYHREVGLLARAAADLVIGVGPLAQHYEHNHWFETSADCAGAVASLIRDGDYVLVKGSHSARLSRVVGALRGAFVAKAP